MYQNKPEFNGKANDYLDKIAKDNTYTNVHNGYTIIPHKLLRCFGLTQYERLIMIDLLSYMGNKDKCYPTQEAIARNLGCSSKSVERNLKTLAQKKLIIIKKTNRNNVYYLPDNLHKHPYLLLSEKTHEFISLARQSVNERELTN
jgi:predicted transcriptional regulator